MESSWSLGNHLSTEYQRRTLAEDGEIIAAFSTAITQRVNPRPPKSKNQSTARCGPARIQELIREELIRELIRGADKGTS